MHFQVTCKHVDGIEDLRNCFLSKGLALLLLQVGAGCPVVLNTDLPFICLPAPLVSLVSFGFTTYFML